jgi:glycoside hydrolase-like protein/PASTA domain-containing protein
MSAWRASPYRAVGIYIGGTNLGCAQPNLTSGWVSAESAAGWHLIPTYVGLQAPNNGCGCSSIDPSQASGEGTAAAGDAVVQARAFGIGPGNPIYDDMEYYARGRTSTSAVLSFLSAWTSTLHSYGYKSGVYGNADSAISDLVAAVGTGFKEPDEIWIADWNGQQTTSDPYVPAGEWSNHQRLHQYSGGHDETYRGVTINIDGDYLDGATAGGGPGAARPSIPDGAFVQVAGSAATYRIAGGAPLLVSDWNAVGGPQPVTVISQQQFSALNRVPRDGTFLQTSAGAEYRVAGGAPLYVSNSALFATARPVVIDQWDIDNITNPAAHLNPVPANGTFLTTTAGQVYRVVGGAPFAVSSWAVFGGPRASVTIDGWDIANLPNPAAHLSRTPADGTVVQGLPSDTYWSFTGGLRKLTLATAAAVQVDDLGLAAFQGIPCVVPSLRHMTLLQAKRQLRLADCRLGKVHRPQRPPPGHTLHVVEQSPRATTSHTPGDKVTVTLG